jgi:hypothetical protein
MGINNISLSPQLLAALYPESLVREKTTPAELRAKRPAKQGPEKKPSSKAAEKSAGQAPEDYRFLGENLRKICFVVSCPETVFLPDDQLEFLTRMLSACHCSMADISVLNAARIPVDINKLIQQLQPKILFLCGISPEFLNLSEPPGLFSISDFQGISTLLIPSLNEINQKTSEGTALKKELWSGLKKLFGL